MAIPDSSATSIERCDPAAEKAVLALAAQAWSEAERPAYWQAIAKLVRNPHANAVLLLAARQRGELVAAQLAQAMPGCVAVVWPPQFASPSEENREPISTLFFNQLARELVASDVRLAQALLPRSDPLAAGLFAAGGFSHAADLLYLAAEASGHEAPPVLPFELDTFTPRAILRLPRLLDRTYVGTLDCPGMDGLRKTADVIAGYQAVGEYRPEMWHIARDRTGDIGCLLVNVHPDVKHAEIVYLGLVPEARGRRWGLTLVRYAQWLAGQANCDRVVLAVDAANRPALGLYDAAGFFQFDSRSVWVRPIH